MESTLTVTEVAERCLHALGGGRARRRDQRSRGRGGWGEAASGSSGLEVRVGDAAKEQTAVRGGHGGLAARPERGKLPADVLEVKGLAYFFIFTIKKLKVY